jgi:prepilin-type N-terminal cleavage/methylation domain-containing protein
MTTELKKQGFTLIELLVGLCLATIVLAAIYSMISTGLRSSSSIEIRVTGTQDVRAALELMAMEIRMASYNPNFANDIWKNEDGSLSANQDNWGIQIATDFKILVEMDIGASSNIGDDPNEMIVYQLDTANKYITRTTNGGVANPFLGANPANPDQERTVRVINADLNIPVFRYYDGKGNNLPTSQFPADIEKIRRIEIILAVETDDVDINSKDRKRIIYSTSVIPRNHAASS